MNESSPDKHVPNEDGPPTTDAQGGGETFRSDRNLLFGIVALQLDFVTREQLIGGMTAWATAKDQRLGDVLVKQKAMTESP